MELIRYFDRLGKGDAVIAGGKGASLGEMTQAGIPVPSGFVILASAFDRFLEEADLNQEIDTILHAVKHDEISTVEHASEKIQALILAVEIPDDIAREILENHKQLGAEFVAVRSSATAEDGATAAWAGQLNTYLNTTEEKVLENVKRCWASLFTPRAIFYRREKDMHDKKISVAVVVQKMIQSEVSGIAFSVHPVTEDYNQLIIEAGFGLGEAIVSGQVTPDSYVIEKSPRRIIDKNISIQSRALQHASKGASFKALKDAPLPEANAWIDIPEPKASSQVLSDEQILELSHLVLKIESHYGFPCDIEWAYESGQFHITQSRPITTLSVYRKEKQTFEKMFARDFCMVALEVAALSEKRENKGWVSTLNPHKPYMLIERTDGTCNIWYNKKGVRWTKETLLGKIKSSEDFLSKVELSVKRGITFIRPLYEKQDAVDRITLLRFIDEFLKTYSWIEAMWWIKSMDSEQVGVGHERIVRLREETETLSVGTEIVIRKSLDVMYPHLGILTSMIRLDELRNDKIPDENILRQRLSGFILVDGDLWRESLQEVAKKLDLQLEIVSVDKDVDSFKGEIAYRGKVSGEVCRVMGHIDFGKIKAGQILVSPMTMVDFLPEMKKAVAFITDEGGIACHAAIVAREMKKPCIIGTKIATQVLKDGDMVEVDADNGVVRILRD